MPKKSTILVKKEETPVVAMAQVTPEVFGGLELDLATLGEVVVRMQSNRRLPLGHTKTRGEVQGSTRKPWRQKGTGRARVGTRRTPLWRGGGIVFGPRSIKNFSKKINRRLLKPALMTALFKQAQAGRVWHLPLAYTAGTRTKLGLRFFQGGLDPRRNLIIINSPQPALRQAVRNLSYIKVLAVNQINVLEVLSARRIIFIDDALSPLTHKPKSNE